MTLAAKKIQSLFLEAVELSAAERRTFVERASDDPTIRDEVLRLLDLEGQAEGFLEPSRDLDLGSWAHEPHTSWPPGTQVGPYRIERILAEGGMGTVYEATQASPQRRVALKTLGGHFVSPTAVKRFRLEAELLASLKHPGIAQIYDAGAHGGEVSVPYFVMELVGEARDVVSFAEEQGLSLPERLRLFGRLCDAVHFGHLKGVIHRDLKPGNLLVDGAGHPKVIDFGLARAVDSSETSLTIAATRVGQVLGTPRYMSPEHFSGISTRIDVRSDVYSLGCVLHEVLVGESPFELGRRRGEEALRYLETAEPKISRRLPQEVRWILLRALAREPERRYGSVLDLTQDLRRFLDHEPVEAGPPSGLYRARKFVQRHRALVLGSIAVVVALGLGLVMADIERRRAEANAERAELERGRAETAAIRADEERKVAVEAQRRAEQTSREIHSLSEVQKQLHDVLVTGLTDVGGQDARLSDLLDRLEGRLQSGLDLVPAARVETLSFLTSAYRNLGRLDRARAAAESAATLASELPPEHAVTAINAKLAWQGILFVENRHAESEACCLELLPLMEREDVVTRDTYGNLLGRLGSSQLFLGKLEESEQSLRRSVDILMASVGERALTTQVSMYTLGLNLSAQDRHAEARDLLEQLLELRRATLDPGHRNIGWSLAALAEVEAGLGDLESAIDHMKEGLEVLERHLGPENPSALGNALQLVSWLRWQGQEGESLQRLEELEPILTRPGSLGPELDLAVKVQRAFLAVHREQWEQALSLLEPVLVSAPAPGVATLDAEWLRVTALAGMGRKDESREALAQWRARVAETLPETHAYRAWSRGARRALEARLESEQAEKASRDR